MSAIIGVVLFAAGAAMFILFRVIFPDRPGETPAGELMAQLASVLITGLFAGGAGAFIDFAVSHDDATGYVWLAAALGATVVLIALAMRIGRRARTA
ncbi:MAG: hypothetical protein ACE37J_22105 [Pikeienuella sp.]|uniref:hypothetical protein n=1 Tax=Pikeienuella sp. TaxID=2831957 RepID=UPI00391CC130